MNKKWKMLIQIVVLSLIWIVAGILVFSVLVAGGLLPFFILELMEDLPIVIPLGVIGFIIVKSLTPNPIGKERKSFRA